MTLITNALPTQRMLLGKNVFFPCLNHESTGYSMATHCNDKLLRWRSTLHNLQNRINLVPVKRYVHTVLCKPSPLLIAQVRILGAPWKGGCLSYAPAGGSPRNFRWGCAAPVSKPEPYFRTNLIYFFGTLYKPGLFWYLVTSIHTRFQIFKPKWLKSVPFFTPKWLKKHTLRRLTYLYRGVPLAPRPAAALCSVARLLTAIFPKTVILFVSRVFVITGVRQ